MRIAVAGGTGWTGKLLVGAIRDSGDTPVVMARSTGVDLTTGQGLPAALEGASVVIDVSNAVVMDRAKSEEFFGTATRHLLAAEKTAGVQHHVLLSIVACDRVDYGYYFGKRLQEQLALNGDVPTTVLRATQFHEFAAQLISRPAFSKRVAPIPTMLSQPIALREVVVALLAAARGEPAGLLPDLAGPEQLRVPDMVRRYAKARGIKKIVVPVRLPGATGRAFAGGGMLPTSDGPRGTQTFAEWLRTDALNLPI